MFRRAVLFLLLLFTASVFAVRRQELGCIPQLRDPVHGDTNGQRLARGLPLLPPARRKNIEASRTEAARRAQASDTNVWTGKLQVADANGTTVGYLALADGGHQYTVREESDAAIFTASLSPESRSILTFRDNDPQTPWPYLAGLIQPDVILRLVKTTSAILGGSAAKSLPNNKPQLASEHQVSIYGMQYETAIWNCGPKNLTILWMDRDSGDIPISVVWDRMIQKIFLTADSSGVVANNPDPHIVTISLSSN
ncbi:uncharacterized protein EI90DRAFT_3088733 [Cantharellus anzutake]|uniref:uncharacterized protein n=1 Tax=Cantharellus anzutake TaxID=1750568 RepID=UPI001904BA4F|nr:uncharacterized protein EI90DRAFT_3088733 [Cantharellus anzutake]KAF8315098.1 hypothetical protein EI90DRAFT_3088733 [Cantharellus anzutake]